MNMFETIAKTLANTTPDWRVIPPGHPNSDSVLIEIHDGFGRTATVYGNPTDSEVKANAYFMCMAHAYTKDFLEVLRAFDHVLKSKMFADATGNSKSFDNAFHHMLNTPALFDAVQRLTRGPLQESVAPPEYVAASAQENSNQEDMRLAGEAPGHGLPDWPEDLVTYAERKAYQRGIADARRIAKADEPMRKHVEGFAAKGGWQKDSGEGAFEFIQRISYAQGLVDAKEPVGRSEQEIVDQTEALAKSLLQEFFNHEPVDQTQNFRHSEHPFARKCWLVACQIQEMLTATDPENAAAEIDGQDGGS